MAVSDIPSPTSSAYADPIARQHIRGRHVLSGIPVPPLSRTECSERPRYSFRKVDIPRDKQFVSL